MARLSVAASGEEISSRACTQTAAIQEFWSSCIFKLHWSIWHPENSICLPASKLSHAV